MVCEKKASTESMHCEESELDSTSDEEGAEEMPPLTDSEMSDIEEEEGDRAVPPLTYGEDSEIDEEVEDLNKKEGEIASEKNLNLEPSKKINKTKKFLKKRRSRNVPEPMSETSDDSSGSESNENSEEDYSD